MTQFLTLNSFQEIKLEDLKHLKDLKPVNSSNEDIKDLLDFNITYQDVNQLISDPMIFTSSSSVHSSSSSFLATNSVQSNRAPNSRQSGQCNVMMPELKLSFIQCDGLQPVGPQQCHVRHRDVLSAQSGPTGLLRHHQHPAT